jgi:hypothetical protein
MTQAVAVLRDGFAFQARMFWIKAAKLLNPNGAIVRVGFESGLRGFDDVWVEYDPAKARPGPYGNPLLIERMQCKWHARNGSFTHIDLTKPGYIGATEVSLLQRARDAHRADRAAGRHSLVKLMTNHRIDDSDALYKLVRSNDHTLRIDELFAGKTARSATGALRKLWQDHLGIDDQELRSLCSSLGLSTVSESLEDLRERMDECFLAHGIRPTVTNASATAYDDTVYKWMSQGILEFDRNTFREKCAQEDLLAEAEGLKGPKVFGVKSFEHSFDRLEDRCDEVLNLVPSFEDRFIKPEASWRDDLLPALRAFLNEAAKSGRRIRLAVDAHSTLAFAAGTILDTKSGRIVELEQRTPNATVVWAPDDASPSPAWPGWNFAEYDLETGGSDVAVAVSLTRSTETDVRRYVHGNQAIGQLLVAVPSGGPSQRSVLCGAHADVLAEALAARLKEERTRGAATKHARTHLFMAVPNAFPFYLGRHIHTLKPITLYEFDFHTERDGSYQPSLSLPETAQVLPTADPP